MNLEKQITKADVEYTGWRTWYPTDDELADFYVSNELSFKLLNNEYLIIKDQKEEVSDQIYKNKGNRLVKINHSTFKGRKDSKDKVVITPRNTEQKCAFDLLTDDDITVKLLTGTWGCGKTFLLVAAALDALQRKKFKKIVWVRNNVKVKDTTDLGALPGDVNEKLLPFLGPFIDHVGNKQQVLKMIEEGQLEVEPLQTLRGRNIENAIIMCSEAENLTKEHLQLIIARCAEGSNVWLDADMRQRDRDVFEKSQGIESLISKLKDDELFGYVKLIKCERSDTARLADKLND